MADPALMKSAFGGGKPSPGGKPNTPKLRPMEQANKPPPDEPGDEDDDLAKGMDDPSGGDQDAGQPLDLDSMGQEWPEVEEAVNALAEAHKSGDMGVFKDAVTHLSDVLAGHGIQGDLSVDDDALDDVDDSDDKGDDDDSDADDDSGDDDSSSDASDDSGDSDDSSGDSDDDDSGDDDKPVKKPAKKGNPFADKFKKKGK